MGSFDGEFFPNGSKFFALKGNCFVGELITTQNVYKLFHILRLHFPVKAQLFVSG